MHANIKVSRCNKLKIQSNPTTFLYSTGREARNRRQVLSDVQLMVLRRKTQGYRDIPREKVCPGGKRKPSFTDEVNCFNAGKDWNVQCRILSKTCYNIVVCETVDDCFEKHVYNTIYCCTYVCIWEASFPMSTTHFTWQCYSIVLDFFVTERASKKIIRI